MRLITITGPSGAGKDTVARMLSEQLHCAVLCSYATRPMRPGEKQGREHHFVEACNVDHTDMLAYTRYGNYEYWATKDQIHGTAIYVIDEDGLKDMIRRFPDISKTMIYVDADEQTRLMRGVNLTRIRRDDDRKTSFSFDFYDYTLLNEGTEAELRELVNDLAANIKKKYSINE